MKRSTVIAAAAIAFSFGGSFARAAATLSATDKTYLSQATEEVLGEATLSRIGDKSAKSEKVKSFAHDMVKGAEKMEKELHVEADKYGYVLPSKDEAAKGRDEQLHALEKKPDFDKAYLDEQIKDHEEMVKLWKKAADKTDLPALKTWFTDKTTVLQENLDRAKALREKLG